MSPIPSGAASRGNTASRAKGASSQPAPAPTAVAHASCRGAAASPFASAMNRRISAALSAAPRASAAASSTVSSRSTAAASSAGHCVRYSHRARPRSASCFQPFDGTAVGGDQFEVAGQERPEIVCPRPLDRRRQARGMSRKQFGWNLLEWRHAQQPLFERAEHTRVTGRRAAGAEGIPREDAIGLKHGRLHTLIHLPFTPQPRKRRAYRRAGNSAVKQVSGQPEPRSRAVSPGR